MGKNRYRATIINLQKNQNEVSLFHYGSTQSGSQGSESVQYFHNDLSRAILVSIITSISQIPIMVPLSVYVSELLPVLQ